MKNKILTLISFSILLVSIAQASEQKIRFIIWGQVKDDAQLLKEEKLMFTGLTLHSPDVEKGGIDVLLSSAIETNKYGQFKLVVEKTFDFKNHFIFWKSGLQDLNLSKKIDGEVSIFKRSDREYIKSLEEMIKLDREEIETIVGNDDEVHQCVAFTEARDNVVNLSFSNHYGMAYVREKRKLDVLRLKVSKKCRGSTGKISEILERSRDLVRQKKDEEDYLTSMYKGLYQNIDEASDNVEAFPIHKNGNIYEMNINLNLQFNSQEK